MDYADSWDYGVAIIPFEGYAPDADPTMPGIFTNCANTVPTRKGFTGAPSPQTTLLPALASACQGAAALRKLDDTTRLFAGTATKLYEVVSNAWTDRTRASGGDYTAASDIRWRFAQFGNVSLAAIKSDVLQSSTSGAFANLTAPKASIVETVNQFVFLFDTNEGTFGDSPQRWWCSAIGSETDWVPAVATQCATGTLLSAPGKITAGRRFGDGIIAYKQNSMYRGIYVGAPAIWEFTQVPGEIGALSQETVVNIGTLSDPRHIFMGADDFYTFDGARPVPIGSALKETVFGEINRSYQHLSVTLHDRINSRVYFYYPGSASTILDKCVVYNYKTGRWGRDDRSIEVAIDYIASSMTYEDVGDLYSTYADLPSISYGSAFWTAGFPIPAIFNTAHLVQTLTGVSTTSSITTGDFGDDTKFTLFSRAKLKYLTAPTSSEMVNYYRVNLGDSLITDQTTVQSSSRFDVLRSARWHRMRFDFSGDWEATGFTPDVREDGLE